MSPTHPLSVPMGELLEDPSLSLQELARACRRAPEWVRAHVEAGVIETATHTGTTASTTTTTATGEWFFTSTTLVRARRIAQLESTFDADPHLAALTADLMEEVQQLRRQLAQSRSA